jgi:hypothetical protein
VKTDDPAALDTAEPDSGRADQTLAASNGQLFRILAIEPEMDEERSAETVGPVGRRAGRRPVRPVAACRCVHAQIRPRGPLEHPSSPE